MNKFISRRSIASVPLLLFLLLLFTAAPASAQESGQSVPGEAGQNTTNQGDNPLGPLNLTSDQLVKIRIIRQQNKEERQLVNERLRSAQRALDEAIYSDNATESEIEERARELATAQAASIRLRALTELSIRRVLTPEQLNTLRTIRRQQAEQRRLERNLNPPRRLRDQQPGNNNQPLLPRERFRQRQNTPALQNDNSQPAAAPRERRGAGLRRVRP
jgi:Spy/CpxP family protein refolding chaperone